MCSRWVDETSIGPVVHLLPAAGRVRDLLVRGRLDEHVARAASRVRPVRVGTGHETGCAAADLPHLLLDVVLRRRSLDELLHLRTLAGREIPSLSVRGVPHRLHLSGECCGVSWHGRYSPSRVTVVPTTEERSTACLTGATGPRGAAKPRCHFRRHAQMSQPPTGCNLSARVLRRVHNRLHDGRRFSFSPRSIPRWGVTDRDTRLPICGIATTSPLRLGSGDQPVRLAMRSSRPRDHTGCGIARPASSSVV